MANGKYGLYLQEQLSPSAAVDWAADNIKACLIDTALYAVNLATDQFLSIIAGAAILATSANLAGKTGLLGVADASDISITYGAGLATCEALVLYKDTGVAATSKLIVYIDTAIGLPFTPVAAGGIQLIQWNASGIFSF